jgi:hemerythrin-like domain-containing protein
MPERKPQSRSLQLRPLSEEHYEGLLFVWRIREGLKKDADLLQIKEFITWFWTNHLVSHFDDEERALVPELPADNKLILQMQEEHAALREYIRNIEKLAASDVQSFAGLLHDHIRFEERELFPQIEKLLSTEQLDNILSQFDDKPVSSAGWTHEFWK